MAMTVGLVDVMEVKIPGVSPAAGKLNPYSPALTAWLQKQGAGDKE
jgi:hypothetical protein